MQYFKTEKDLEQVLNLNKPEKVVRLFWEEAEKNKLQQEFIDSKKEEYAVQYSIYEDYVEYIDEVKNEVLNEETMEIETEVVPVYKDDYYIVDPETNEKVLKPEILDLINKGQVKPSLDYFIKKSLDEYLENNSFEADLTKYPDFIKPYLLKLVNIEFERAMSMITAAYPDHEQKTWDQQEAEARAYQADENAVTPLLDNISTIREIDKAELASRVIEKADSYKNILGLAIGYRQKAEDVITAIEDIETLDKVLIDLENDRDVFYNLLEG